MNIKSVLSLAALTALSATLVACGSDEASDTAAPPTVTGAKVSKLPLGQYAAAWCKNESVLLQGAQMPTPEQINDPSWLSTTFADQIVTTANGYRVAGNGLEALGDPPTGEASGVSKELSAQRRATADEFDRVAAIYRRAADPNGMNEITSAQSAMGVTLTDLNRVISKYPAPKLQESLSKEAGCADYLRIMGEQAQAQQQAIQQQAQQQPPLAPQPGS